MDGFVASHPPTLEASEDDDNDGDADASDVDKDDDASSSSANEIYLMYLPFVTRDKKVKWFWI